MRYQPTKASYFFYRSNRKYGRQKYGVHSCILLYQQGPKILLVSSPEFLTILHIFAICWCATDVILCDSVCLISCGGLSMRIEYGESLDFGEIREGDWGWWVLKRAEMSTCRPLAQQPHQQWCFKNPCQSPPSPRTSTRAAGTTDHYLLESVHFKFLFWPAERAVHVQSRDQ